METGTRNRTRVQGENGAEPPPGSRAAVKRFIGRIREKASPQMSFQLHDVTSAVASFPPSLSPRDVEGPPANTIRDNHSERLIRIVK